MIRALIVCFVLAGLPLAGCSKKDEPARPESPDPVPMPQVFEEQPPDAGQDPVDLPAGPDIDTLADAAYHRPGGAEGTADDKNTLWAAVYQLKAWLVLMSPENTAKGPMPHITEHGGNRWVMVFTDPERLRAYAKEHELAGKHGEVRMLSLRIPLAEQWLVSLQDKGIHGVRFNQGAHGWYAPLAQLEPIRTFLEGKGLL